MNQTANDNHDSQLSLAHRLKLCSCIVIITGNDIIAPWSWDRRASRACGGGRAAPWRRRWRGRSPGARAPGSDLRLGVAGTHDRKLRHSLAARSPETSPSHPTPRRLPEPGPPCRREIRRCHRSGARVYAKGRASSSPPFSEWLRSPVVRSSAAASGAGDERRETRRLRV
jgi:hypothetical protein